MGISAASNRWLNRLYKIIAILLVIFAALISGFRLFLPYVNNYSPHLQAFINETYQTQMRIGSLTLNWDQHGPLLVAEQVDVLDSEIAKIFVNKVEVSVDFWRSLLERKVITHDIVLVGADVIIDKTLLSNHSESQQTPSIIENVSDVIFQQIRHFSLDSSKLTILTEKQDRTFLISNLAWLNYNKNHKATGYVLIDGLTSNNLKFDLDVNGDDFSDMNGQLYLAASKLNITPWLDQIFAIEDENTSSSINFNAWLTLESGAARQLQVKFGENEVSWFYKDQLHSLSLAQGHLLVDNLNQYQQTSVVSSPLYFFTNNHAWQPITFETQRTIGGFTTYLSSIEVFGLADLYPLFSGHLENQTLLDDLAPVGQLTDIHLSMNKDQLKATAKLDDISTHYSQGIPGLDNVSGELSLDHNQLTLDLLAKNGQLDFGKHFLQPIPYQTIASQLKVDFSEQGWRLSTDNLEVQSSQLHLTAELALNVPTGGATTMALLANVHRGDAKFASYYYPHLLMGNNLVDYLNLALIDGKVEQGQVVVNGPLNKFPFADGGGTFIVDAELTNSQFQFDPQWPMIKAFQANINFTNNSMLITGRGGDLTGIDVSGVEVAIDDLMTERILTVEAGFTNTAPELITDLMNNSPMVDTVGATLDHLRVSEPISGHFSLNLPLKDLDSVVASGRVAFKNNHLALQSPEMNFSDINGQLLFENDVISTDKLRLNWRGMPVAIQVNASDMDSDFYQTKIAIQGNWSELAWQKQVPELLKKYASGQLDWQSDLVLKMHHDGRFFYDLEMESSLDSIALELPEPYQKSQHQPKSLAVNVLGSDARSIFNIDMGDDLGFYGELDHQQTRFTKAHLMLGDDDMFFPAQGFHISTKLAQASLAQWQSLVIDIIDSIEAQRTSGDETLAVNDSPALLSSPDRIRGTIGQLDILEQNLTDVSFNLLDETNWWLLDLNAKEARAQLKFYPDWHEQGIDIDADFIHIPLDEKKEVAKNKIVTAGQTTKTLKEEVSPDTLRFDNDKLFANIPLIRAKCESCRYGRFDLGKVDFALERSAADTLTIKKFTAQRDKTKLSFDATWQHNEQLSKTSIVGKLTSKDVEREMEKLGYPSTVKDSGLKSTYTFDWSNSPLDFQFADLNGDVNVRLDEGYLAEVPDEARAFSILSFQSLVRKLKFDFRDIFSDGMFYDEIKGDFHLDKGILYTDNTFMKGAAGDLTIKGNTDLNTEILDYKMSYKPNLTSSLPAIAWIYSSNPVLFLAGLALNEVITSKVVSEYKFEVTGALSNPVMKEVDRKTQNIRVGRSTPPEVIENLPVSTGEPDSKSTTEKPPKLSDING